MNELVLPLYLSLACVMFGLALAARPARDLRLISGEHGHIYDMLGGFFAALACICIALAPLIGRAFLALSSVMLVLSILSTALRVRSWHHPLTVNFMRFTTGTTVAGCFAMVTQGLLGSALVPRVLTQLTMLLVLLSWLLIELKHVMRLRMSLQLKLMRICAIGIMVLASVWSFLVIFNNDGVIVHFSSFFSEAWFAFSIRLFIVALLVLMLVSANGFGLERMVSLKASASRQKEEAEQLNQRLTQVLSEKNEMLQALSFAVRSQNLPAIMSSLSHEINQPLGAIRLNADYLLADNSRLTAQELHQVLQQLVSCSEAVSSVVKDFRRFFETEPTAQVQVSLQCLLADLARGLHTEFDRQNVNVTLIPGEDVSVLGDPVQLESALVGVIRFMLQRTGGQPRAMNLRHVCVGRYVHVRLLSDGPALTQQEFEMAFVRIPQTTWNTFSHGLWLSRAIVEHHGGAMNAYNSQAHTGISLQLPILKGNP